ncbi:hypothetical protein A4G99_19350 [Haladaptatus sp. R4]|nr:hypothetical protein A4G99_19350 [Haladaptatus sp. R4]
MLFRAVISESEVSLDFVDMALIVQPFDDIFGSRPLKIFFLSQNGIGLLVGEFTTRWNCARERIKRFLRKWCEWRRLVWTHLYYQIRGHDR